ncbi:glycosyltransferase family 2 protein [Streptomyces sp. NA02950]|uniref:glycosyltransferase family 2 protein n=1 Tax=Streptomyces sp. NA02950 TaxID=2742137 RepID=UPI0015918370|nr:glycosyltransferase family 2 protein [Streptomyces sp. NA02950]QKV94634.1 glycosyltransferase family 2 protein [Streptomyces sp. NA02950]
MSRTPRPGPRPRVSVIVPAYNAMPELTRAIDSARNQTIGIGRLEIIAVDDGSTDGTAAELDRLAAECPALKVVHQPNSGGAGGPRNTGLDLARGDYVFFLDADDHLGPDALRRMVAMADQNGTDVVLGKMVSERGRGVPRAVFQHTQLRTDVYSSHAYSTLGPCKLFRRSLIERLRLRFPPCRNGEDKPFTAAAYLNASGISVVADYDCYHVDYRENGQNLTRTAVGLADRIDGMRALFETAARYTRPGTRRDKVMRRHIQWELCGALRALPREDRAEARGRYFPELRTWALAHCSDALFRILTAPERLLVHLLRADRFDDLMAVLGTADEDTERGLLVDKGRVYWLHPYFRDPEAAVPDACFDVTDHLPVRHHLAGAGWHGGSTLRVRGSAAVEGLDRDPEDRTELVLRRRESTDELRLPVTTGDGAEFAADVDIATADAGAPLRPGVWDLYLDVRAQGISRTVRFGSRHDDGLDINTARRVVAAGPGLRARVSPYFTTPYGNLSLDIGPAPQGAPCEVTEAVWHPSEKGTLVVAGRLLPPGSPARDRVLRLRAEHADGRVLDHPVRFAAGHPAGAFTARLSVRDLSRGRWTVTLALVGPGGTRGDGPSHAAPVPPPPRLPGARWLRRGRPYYAKPLTGNGQLTLELRVAPVRLAAALRNRLRRR